MPGNWDRLNCRALFPGTNQWGVPDLPAVPLSWEPARLVSYADRYATDTARAGDAVHFFLDDYRFETLWTKPERGLSRCKRVGAALTPDFSLWRDMPLVMQMWQTYRSRWCGAWLMHQGVRVIPAVSWSTPDSYPFAFAGLPQGSTVAISSVGVLRDPAALQLFTRGYAEMLRQLQPARVLVYGELPSCSVGEADRKIIREYPTRWATR